MQAQIDGNVVKARFTLPPRQKVSPPPRSSAIAPKRDAPRTDNASADAKTDVPKQPRECMYILDALGHIHIHACIHIYINGISV